MLLKIHLLLLNQENLDEYKIDLKNLVESYNGLIFQINLISKDLDD